MMSRFPKSTWALAAVALLAPSGASFAQARSANTSRDEAIVEAKAARVAAEESRVVAAESRFQLDALTRALSCRAGVARKTDVAVMDFLAVSARGGDLTQALASIDAARAERSATEAICGG